MKARRKMPMRGNWSDLDPDLLSLIFEHLPLVDFCRARAVCSAWYSASRLCLFKRESFPWLILFPKKRGNYNCLLFNPEEDKIYAIRDLGYDFDRSKCLASHGSWFLFLNLRADLYIMNPLTREKIHLPPIECLDGQPKFLRQRNKFLFAHPSHGPRRICQANLGEYFSKAVLWTDERSRDYLVILVVEYRYIVCCRKGDDRWKEVPDTTTESRERRLLYKDVAYRNSRLYVKCDNSFLTPCIRIWDFERDFPVETTKIQIDSEDYKLLLADMAITLSGDILLTAPSPSSRPDRETWINILVFKFYPEEGRWESIGTLGDEALILDQRITAPSKDVKGMKRDSIYFSYEGYCLPLYDLTVVDTKNKIGAFDLGTGLVKGFQRLPRGSFRDAQWFFPGFGKMFQ